MEEEIIQAGDWDYWNEFIGWYEGVIDECDGYLDDPAYLETYIGTMNKTLKIEFHPGDISMIDLEEENRAEACKLFQDRLIAAAIFDGELCEKLEKLVRMVFS